MKKLTTGKIWQFAAGQFGWAMLSGIISNWLVYFYQPDKTAISQGQTVFIPQGLVVFGIFTIIGGITAFGRIFDAFTDPMIASLSDRCTSKNGRRIPFLKWASLPLALSTVLVFWSPVNKNSWINGVFLLIMILAYYLSITAYCTPYNALIPELGHTQQERLNISTVISFTFIAGTAVAYLAPTIWGMFIPAFGRVGAIRMTFTLMAAIAFICMLVPVFCIREKDYVDTVPAKESAFGSLAATFKNGEFRKFVASDIFYWIALTMFQTGLPFFVTSLLKLPETMTTLYFVGIHVQRYLAEKPKGVIIISHGFTEAAPKYEEMIYYFLKAGYHVYMPEHMGHGQSYCLTADPSLVHIDTWKRYVRDFLKICHVIKKTYPELPLVLFAHSMGGAIGTIAAAWEPQLFQKIILNSPMLRPLTGNVPWPLVIAIAQTKCLLGREEDYVAGQKPYDGSETFETSGCTSRPRFEKYNEMRKENKKFQVSAASYGWLLASVKMSWYIKYCGWKKLTAPVLLFQAERDDFVSVNALRKFAEKINHRGITSCEYVYLPGTRHETYRSDDRTMEMYLDKIMKFMDSGMVSDSCT